MNTVQNVEAVYCSECRQVMPIGKRPYRKIFDAHNQYHKFVPDKSRQNIVQMTFGASIEEIVGQNVWESPPFGYTIVEALAGLEVEE